MKHVGETRNTDRNSDFSENNKPQPPKSPTSLKIHSLYLELNFTVVSQKLLNYNLKFLDVFTFQCIFVYPIQQGIGDEDGCVVRLRGLPWSATESEVVKFFGGKLMMIFSLLCKYIIFCKVCSTLLHRKLE